MKELNEHIEFLEMTGDSPQLLVWLLELRRHREDNWKQRAEAAEAKLALVREQRDSELNRNTELEAKLAELEKQEPAGKFAFEPLAERYHHIKHGEAQNMEPKLPLVKLFARPAPAVSLVELLEVSANKTADRIYHLFDGIYDDSSRAWSLANDVWDACHAAILRNIEEQSQ